MTDQQPQDGVREIIAITAAATDEAGVNAYEVAIAEGWTDVQPEWLVVADAILAALTAGGYFIGRIIPCGEEPVLTFDPDDYDLVPAAGEKGGE